MKSHSFFLYILIGTLLVNPVSGQNHKMDSLWKVWNNKLLPDTTRFSALGNIGFQLCFTNPDSGVLISNMLIKEAGDKGSKKWVGGGYNALGNNLLSLANYPASLDAFVHAMKLFEETNDKYHVASMYVNEGMVYESMSNYPKGLECYQDAIKKYREIGDTTDAESEMGNVGIIYWYLNDYKKALEYELEALSVQEKEKDKLDMGGTLTNLGLFYTKVPDFAKAMEYLNKAVDVNREVNNLQGLANSYGNISIVYGLKPDYTNALAYQVKCFDIQKQIGDKQGMALSYINIASYNLKLKHYKEAEQFSDSGANLGKKIGALDIQRDAHL
ncbi:MAG TPA: tetratricopeptide repeat protein, partial [Bacteroidia bacterium]|nr:tetratricopeptide repeat protein [Bacteroidia bacterium]